MRTWLKLRCSTWYLMVGPMGLTRSFSSPSFTLISALSHLENPSATSLMILYFLGPMPAMYELCFLSVSYAPYNKILLYKTVSFVVYEFHSSSLQKQEPNHQLSECFLWLWAPSPLTPKLSSLRALLLSKTPPNSSIDTCDNKPTPISQCPH